MDLQLITEKVIAACKEANKKIIQPILQANELKIQDKDNSGRNFVTQADLETELFLKAELSHILSEANFIAEETAEEGKPIGFNWIIDPIDGTTNFMHGLFPACISVALTHNEEVLCGVVFELFHSECFYAWKGGGAYLNGKKIVVSKNVTLASSLLVTGFPYVQDELFDRWIALYGTMTKKTQGVRRFGAAAYDLCAVAAGRFEAYYEYNLNAWDVAAGALILLEAGGTVTDFFGEQDYLFGKSLIASNGLVHEELYKLLQEFSLKFSQQ